MTEKTGSNTANQSTIAAFAILEEMAQKGEPSRVTDLGKALNMPRARIYRYLQTLVTLGYVRQDPETERYQLTLKLFHLGQAIADSTQLTSVARPVMSALRDELGQTVTLSIPEPNGMRVIDIVRVESPVQIITRPGAILDFHTSAQGKLALAFGKYDPDKLISSADIRAKVAMQAAHAREFGWVTAPEETLPGVNAISAPVFDLEGNFAATITVVGSVQDIKPEPAEIYVTAVTRAAREISNNLGCMEYPI